MRSRPLSDARQRQGSVRHSSRNAGRARCCGAVLVRHGLVTRLGFGAGRLGVRQISSGEDELEAWCVHQGVGRMIRMNDSVPSCPVCTRMHACLPLRPPLLACRIDLSGRRTDRLVPTWRALVWLFAAADGVHAASCGPASGFGRRLAVCLQIGRIPASVRTGDILSHARGYPSVVNGLVPYVLGCSHAVGSVPGRCRTGKAGTSRNVILRVPAAPVRAVLRAHHPFSIRYA